LKDLILKKRLRQRRFNKRWSNGVHSDSVSGQIERHGFRNPLQQNLRRHHLLAKAHLGRAIHIDQMNEGFGSGGSDFGPPMRPALAPAGEK
jgi:hypothetical protein